MIFFQQTQRLLRELLQEGGQYANLQKQAMQKDFSQGLSQLLGSLAVSFILLLLLIIVLLFACVSLAFLIGQALDSTALGFAIMAGVFLLILCLVAIRSDAWIIQPLHRMTDEALGCQEITLTREELETQMNQSRARMQNAMQQLSSANARTTDNMQRVSRWAAWGYTAYEGMRVGSSIVSSISQFFGRGRRRRR